MRRILEGEGEERREVELRTRSLRREEGGIWDRALMEGDKEEEETYLVLTVLISVFWLVC